MNVLHILTNTSGGAAKAAIRLHRSLLKNGTDSHLLTLNNDNGEVIPNLHIFGKTVESTPTIILPNTSGMPFPFNKFFKTEKEKIKEQENYTYFLHNKKDFELFTWNRNQILELTQLPLFQKADIINLHWVSYFLDWPTFFKHCKKPIVWTMHDMNPFTGGCHYALDCSGFKSSCENCPQLKSDFDNSGHWRTWALKNQRAKQKCIHHKNVHVVADSHWLEQECRESTIFSNNTSFQTIHYGIETDVFVPKEKSLAKEHLGIDPNKITIGFGAERLDNKRKGLSELLAALKILQMQFSNITCLVFGAGNFDEREGLPTIKSFGTIKENEQLADIYSACDVFVVPSLYEAFGQTAIEAMSCGTPVVAFNTGGLKDSVIPNQTGLLAERGNPNDLANKIGELLANPEARLVIGKKARVLVEEKFNFELQSTRYASLYNSIL